MEVLMKYISDESTGIDLMAAGERADAWENVRVSMKLGLITPENFQWEDRNTVRRFFDQLPLIEMVDARRGIAKLIGEVDLFEGRDWAFATSRDGVFGVFSLSDDHRDALQGAVFHLWVSDSNIDPQDEGRVEFTDLGDYQEAALEAALAA